MDDSFEQNPVEVIIHSVNAILEYGVNIKLSTCDSLQRDKN